MPRLRGHDDIIGVSLDYPARNAWAAVGVGSLHTITTQTSSATCGTVSAGGDYAFGTVLALKATPAAGCSFVNWTEANLSATPTVVSTSATFNLTVNSSRTLKANFTQP